MEEWSLDDLVTWEAFFRMKADAERRAMEQARRGNPGYGPTRYRTGHRFIE